MVPADPGAEGNSAPSADPAVEPRQVDAPHEAPRSTVLFLGAGCTGGITTRGGPDPHDGTAATRAGAASASTQPGSRAAIPSRTYSSPVSKSTPRSGLPGACTILAMVGYRPLASCRSRYP